MTATLYHIPVLFEETLNALNIQPNGVYVDATFGGGGHSRAILQQLHTQGTLIAFDQDKDCLTHLPQDPRFVFIHNNFRYLKNFLRLRQITQIDGLLIDLGVSSHQIDTAVRGFSMRYSDAPLDMRMNQAQDKNAQNILQTYSETELCRIFKNFGEISNAAQLAHTVIHYRKEWKITHSGHLKQMALSCSIGNPNRYLAQVYQALRIAVNDELDALSTILKDSMTFMKPKARLCVISFHSLEDRIVKQFIKKQEKQQRLKNIHLKPIAATAQELQRNKRSRSAKLRVAEKLS